MNDEKRVAEIKSQITAFNKESYSHDEFLLELFELQK